MVAEVANPPALLTPAWTPLNYHQKQHYLWRCPSRMVAVDAGRGSGKTELAFRRLVRFLAVKKPWPDPLYFYGAPTEAQAKRVAWNKLHRLIPRHWIKKIAWPYIETIFGSSLYVMGMDKPHRSEGQQWDGILIDESSDIQPGVMVNLLPTLAHRSPWIWRIGVPKRRGIGAREFKQFCDDATANPYASRFTWSAEDIMPPEAIRIAKKTLDKRDYDEQYRANWQTDSGGCFHAFDRDANVRPCLYRPDKPIIIGQDFNVDPMAWVFGHRWEKRIEWFGELYRRNTNTPECLKLTWEKFKEHQGGFEFYPDASSSGRSTSADKVAPSDLAILRNEGHFRQRGRVVRVSSANPRVKDRIAACNALLCNANGDRRMFVDPSCVHLIEDLQLRNWEKNAPELTHATDAMGYAVWKLFPIRTEIEYAKAPTISITTF